MYLYKVGRNIIVIDRKLCRKFLFEKKKNEIWRVKYTWVPETSVDKVILIFLVYNLDSKVFTVHCDL